MPKGYETISLPSDLLDMVRVLLKTYPDLGYASLAEFVKEGVRNSLIGYEKYVYSSAFDEAFKEHTGKELVKVLDEQREDSWRRIGRDREKEHREAFLRALDAAIAAVPVSPPEIQAAKPVLLSMRRMMSAVLVGLERRHR
ncbi:MAG TPA: hypothetical protein VEY12_05455 [Thermoplasmata archaeon]|nr:hypothetical protein [Thermoplasmata archaeon]